MREACTGISQKMRQICVKNVPMSSINFPSERTQSGRKRGKGRDRGVSRGRGGERTNTLKSGSRTAAEGAAAAQRHIMPQDSLICKACMCVLACETKRATIFVEFQILKFDPAIGRCVPPPPCAFSSFIKSQTRFVHECARPPFAPFRIHYTANRLLTIKTFAISLYNVASKTLSNEKF